MTLEPMTDEERDFAEQHHDMVYKFLRAHRLPEPEYYDVVIFGYLEAVQRNFRVFIEPEKRNFPALAKLCMGSAVRHELYSRWLLIRVANTTATSMDAPLLDDENLSFHDIVPDKTSYVMEEVENRDLIRRALNAASERELEVFALRCSGFSPAEISQILNISIHTTHKASCDLHLKTRPIKDGAPPGKTSAQNYYQSHKAGLNEKNAAYRAAHRDEIRAKRAAKKTALNAPNIESGSLNVNLASRYKGGQRKYSRHSIENQAF